MGWGQSGQENPLQHLHNGAVKNVNIKYCIKPSGENQPSYK